MAKLTKQTVAAATKAPVKPKVTKAATKAVAKTPVKTPRKTTAKLADKAPVKPVETPKVPAKAVLAKETLSSRTKKVENKPRKPRKPRSFRTDTSKFRKYNNELRINLRNLIYDKGYTIAKVAREMGILPHYLFNVLKLNKTSEGGNDAVVVLDIAYAVCSVIGANISSVLPEAEIVNPIYKSTNDMVDKFNKLQEENVKLNFLFTQTKQQLDTQSVKLAASETRIKELENFLESSFNKIGKIRERLANISKSEESKS